MGYFTRRIERIHRLSFGQLKQNLRQELHDYHHLKTYIGGYHIKTVYRQCNKAGLKRNETFTWTMPARWCTCKRRIVDLPHKSYTHAYYRAVRKKCVIAILGVVFETYKEQLEMFKKHEGRRVVNH